MKDESHGVKPYAAVRPLFLTKANSVAATGLEFRRWKEHFPALVRHVGRKDVIVASELERAVASRGTGPVESDGSVESADPAEQVRELLRRAGGR